MTAYSILAQQVVGAEQYHWFNTLQTGWSDVPQSAAWPVLSDMEQLAVLKLVGKLAIFFLVIAVWQPMEDIL